MPLYEHTFLARQDVTQAQVESLMKEFQGVVEEGAGKITKQEYWGIKNLAFKIKKNRKAHYAFFNIDAPPAAVTEMERRMGIHTDVIRFMTVRVDDLETEPSIQMRKQDRDERGDRDRGFGGGRGGPPRGDRGGFGGREGGSTFRSRPPREGDRPPREGDRGPRPPREGEAPRAPRPPRDPNTGSEG
jgi:small subunit ribosomal protein S6